MILIIQGMYEHAVEITAVIYFWINGNNWVKIFH